MEEVESRRREEVESRRRAMEVDEEGRGGRQADEKEEVDVEEEKDGGGVQ
jgi:hypothetical protein